MCCGSGWRSDGVGRPQIGGTHMGAKKQTLFMVYTESRSEHFAEIYECLTLKEAWETLTRYIKNNNQYSILSKHLPKCPKSDFVFTASSEDDWKVVARWPPKLDGDNKSINMESYEDMFMLEVDGEVVFDSTDVLS